MAVRSYESLMPSISYVSHLRARSVVEILKQKSHMIAEVDQLLQNHVTLRIDECRMKCNGEKPVCIYCCLLHLD